MDDDLPHDFIPAIDKLWGRLFSPFDGEALNARNLIKNYLGKCNLHPTDVVIAPRIREKLAASLVCFLEKYESEKSAKKELEQQLAVLQAQLAERDQTIADLRHSRPTARPWEEAIADIQPDNQGYVPYPAFLVALLARRRWRMQDSHEEFARLADVEQQQVTHWRERGKVPHQYYRLLGQLAFGKGRRPDMKWTATAVEMLREYFSRELVLSDTEIAKAMSKRLGCPISGDAVHCKALKLGLLKKTKGSRRKKAA